MDKEEAIRKMEIDKLKITPTGYESPLEIYTNSFVSKLVEQKENAIMAEITEQVGVNVSKEELVKALNYDRDQYDKGYRAGFLEGYKLGMEFGKDIVIEELKRGIEARFMRELDVRENKDD